MRNALVLFFQVEKRPGVFLAKQETPRAAWEKVFTYSSFLAKVYDREISNDVIS